MTPVTPFATLSPDGAISYAFPDSAPGAEPDWEAAPLAELLHALRSCHPLEAGTPEYSRHMMMLGVLELCFVHRESLRDVVRKAKNADELKASLVKAFRDDWAKRKAEGA